MDTESTEGAPPHSALGSVALVGFLALAIIALVLGVVYGLPSGSVLPMNYQGFDNK